MACGPANNLGLLGSLQDLGECSAIHAEVKNNPTDENSKSVPEAQSSHKSLNKPVKLNFDGLFQPASAKKITQRQLFGPGRNLMKDIQNKAAVRKTLSTVLRCGDIQNKAAVRKTLSTVLRCGPPSARRGSGNFKAPLVKPKSTVNDRRPSVVTSQYGSCRRDSKILQRKTQLPLASGYIRNTQKISAGSDKKEAVRRQNGNGSVTAIPSRQTNVNRKVMGHIPRHENLENSVNLLNVDDVEEKLVNEASLLKSQVLKQIHKNTGEVNAYDVKNGQKILNEQTVIKEKLKHMDEKLDKTLNELTDLKEIIKKLSSNQESNRKSGSCNCHATKSTVTESGDFPATNNLHEKVIQPTSDELLPQTDNCVPDSESKTYSLRRSLRLNNKGAQYAYDSLRKSTKLLTTPRLESAKKTSTPGRLTRKVIAQLNDLYHD